MSILSQYKRGCDRCSKEIDVNDVITLKRQPKNKHLCKGCAKYLLKDTQIKPKKDLYTR
jgi:hypothetical protein